MVYECLPNGLVSYCSSSSFTVLQCSVIGPVLKPYLLFFFAGEWTRWAPKEAAQLWAAATTVWPRTVTSREPQVPPQSAAHTWCLVHSQQSNSGYPASSQTSVIVCSEPAVHLYCISVHFSIFACSACMCLWFFCTWADTVRWLQVRWGLLQFTLLLHSWIQVL